MWVGATLTALLLAFLAELHAEVPDGSNVVPFVDIFIFCSLILMNNIRRLYPKKNCLGASEIGLAGSSREKALTSYDPFGRSPFNQSLATSGSKLQLLIFGNSHVGSGRNDEHLRHVGT